MPIAQTGDLVARAASERVGVGAFNVITLEHAEGIVAGAERAGRSVILQLSENAIAYHGGRLRPLTAFCVAMAKEAQVPVALHLDHVQDPQLLRRTAEVGFSSVMFDGSVLPFEENCAATRAAADWAHAAGLWLEAELGEVGGKEGAHQPGARTDPDEAVEFVRTTGVDALAVAVGSAHAMTTRTADIDLELVARLRAALSVPLVLHGSSGVANHLLRRATRAGMAKINVGTLLNRAFTDSVRKSLAGNPDLVDVRKYLAPAREALSVAAADILYVLSS